MISLRPCLRSTPNPPPQASPRPPATDAERWVYLATPSLGSPCLNPVSDASLSPVPTFSPLTTRTPVSASSPLRSPAEPPSPMSEREFQELEAFIAQLKALLEEGTRLSGGPRAGTRAPSEVTPTAEAKTAPLASPVKVPATGLACMRLGLRGAPTEDTRLPGPWARSPMHRLAEAAGAAAPSGKNGTVEARKTRRP
ncbi:MAG TPA: hypothetical protein VFH51_12230 [Myxococcota bacterium]|nr:hypothetical protein [Myxococcota bacterium]